jgi:hypothetical protein
MQFVFNHTTSHRDRRWRAHECSARLRHPHVGDLAEGHPGDKTQAIAQWDNVEAIIERLGIPFFYVAGNHGEP